jgi:O-antigen/teichoic acid export membrane protein
LIRKALLILSGNAFASVLLLARTVIVARMISVEDFGIAATFALSMAVIEMLSALGLQQQIVQAKDGNDPRLQAGLQGFQVLRGIFSGVVLFLLAGPIARFLGVPEVTWAYQLLALVPVMNALVHFDVYRMNRTMVYLPGILTVTVPALVSVAIVWPLALWFGDWRVMLFAIMAQSLVTVTTSHLVAERPYRLLFDRAIIAQSLRFGWPLLANGVLLFLVFNGEKLIVGRELGMEALAIFSMGFTLTLAPTLVMARSIQTFFLPQLSSRGPGVDQVTSVFGSLARATLQASVVNGSLVVLLVFCFGPLIVHVLLGEKYATLVPILTGLAVMQGLRVFKSGSAVVALSQGKTANAMVANLFRVAVLPLSWLALTNGGGLSDVIWIGTFGELLGFLVALLMVRRSVQIDLRPLVPGFAIAAALLLVAALETVPFIHVMGPDAAHWLGPVLAALLFILMVATMRDLVQYVARRQFSSFED